MESFDGLYKVKTKHGLVSINSERYQAILRTRLRKLLIRKGVPFELFKDLKTRKALFDFANMIKPQCGTFKRPGRHFS